MASPSFVNATLGVAGTCSTPRPAWGVTVGVLMGVAGSLGINVGQNMQANGIEQLAEVQRVRPQVSRLWRVGLGVFALFAVINFAALALAPASILTPMESIQFVSNIAWNRFVNRRKISSRMLLGVLLTMVGTVLSVVFGAEGSSCPSSAQLESFWSSPGWIAYLAISLPVALAAHAAHTELERRRLKRSGGGQPSSRRHEVLGAMAYTLSASLAGGAQLVVHSKGFTTLVTVLLQGEGAPLRSWPLYVEASILLLCGALWGIRLTACLSYYDPLLILPLMVGAYILFGGIAGGIFFHEFETLHHGPGGSARWPLYILGMALVLGGLALISIASISIEHREVAAAPPQVELPKPAEPSPGALFKPRELSVEVVMLEERGKAMNRLLSPSPSAAALPTPLSSVRARQRLVQLRQTIELMSVPASPDMGTPVQAPEPMMLPQKSKDHAKAKGARSGQPNRWPVGEAAGGGAAGVVT